MGTNNDELNFQKQVENAKSAGVLTRAMRFIGKNLFGVSTDLQVRDYPTFNLCDSVGPVYDISKTVGNDQFIFNRSVVPPPAITGDVITNFVTPSAKDRTYLNFEITEGNARNVTVTLLDPNNTRYLDLFVNKAPDANKNVFMTRGDYLPFFLPAGFILSVTILSMASTDANAIINFTAIERPMGLGPYSF